MRSILDRLLDFITREAVPRDGPYANYLGEESREPVDVSRLGGPESHATNLRGRERDR